MALGFGSAQTVGSARVRLEVDRSGFDRDWSRAQRDVSHGSSVIGKTAKAGFLALGVGVAAAGTALFKFSRDAIEAQKVTEQTNAVIKSTGGVANVSAKDVDRLATSLMKKTGVDDEAIKSGENMLLTFTRVRNETGKGNDIFDRATRATLDLSVAMGKDMQSSAILVGKALNDPIRGATALTRAGVQLTDQQKAQITTFVKNGRMMDAQKIILRELTTQFGGSAEAVAKADGGLGILRERLANVGEDIGRLVIPALGGLVSFAEKTVIPALEGLSGFLRDLFAEDISFSGRVRIAATGLRNIATRIRDAVASALAQVDWQAVGQTIVNGITAALRGARALAQRLVAVISETVARINWERVGERLGPGFVTMLLSAINALLDFGFWRRNWQLILVAASLQFGRSLKILGWAFRRIDDVLQGVLQALPGRAGSLARRIVPAIVNAIKDLPLRVRLYFRLGLQAIGELIGAWIVLAGRLVVAFVRQIDDKLLPLPGTVTGVLRSTLRRIRDLFAAFFAAARALGERILDGVLNGLRVIVTRVQGRFLDLGRGIRGMASGIFNAAKAVGSAVVDGIVDGLKSLPGRVKGAIGGFIGGTIGRIGEGILDHAARVPVASNPGGLSPWLLDELGLAQRMGLRLTSGLRPGAITASGRPSLHSVGQAIDVAGSPRAMAMYARAVIGRPGVAEVIHTPIGAWYPGVGWTRPTGATAAMHYDHVHVGVRSGDGRVGLRRGDGRVGTGPLYPGWKLSAFDTRPFGKFHERWRKRHPRPKRKPKEKEKAYEQRVREWSRRRREAKRDYWRNRRSLNVTEPPARLRYALARAELTGRSADDIEAQRDIVKWFRRGRGTEWLTREQRIAVLQALESEASTLQGLLEEQAPDVAAPDRGAQEPIVRGLLSGFFSEFGSNIFRQGAGGGLAMGSQPLGGGARARTMAPVGTSQKRVTVIQNFTKPPEHPAPLYRSAAFAAEAAF